MSTPSLTSTTNAATESECAPSDNQYWLGSGIPTGFCGVIPTHPPLFLCRVHSATLLLSKGLSESGNEVVNDLFFDTLKVYPRLDPSEIRHRASEMKINLRYYEDGAVRRKTIFFKAQNAIFFDFNLVRHKIFLYAKQ